MFQSPPTHPAGPHPLNWGHPDDPGGRYDEVPEGAHVAGLLPQLRAAVAGRVVAVPTPRAADGNDLLREAKHSSEVLKRTQVLLSCSSINMQHREEYHSG